MGEYSDKELLNMYRNGDSRSYAFNLIVRKYQERLYWHIRRIVIDHDDADDVVQNVFIKAWKGLTNFREEANMYTWLYRIATNESITFLKKKKKDLYVSLDESAHQAAIASTGQNYYSGDEIQLKLQQAILQLPDKQRLVFNMKYFEDKKYDEIAAILGTSVGALKASYHHAVKKLEKFLTSD
jgi:RNA polymerase sigma factor (sigma-70 family)